MRAILAEEMEARVRDALQKHIAKTSDVGVIYLGRNTQVYRGTSEDVHGPRT